MKNMKPMGGMSKMDGKKMEGAQHKKMEKEMPVKDAGCKMMDSSKMDKGETDMD